MLFFVPQSIQKKWTRPIICLYVNGREYYISNTTWNRYVVLRECLWDCKVNKRRLSPSVFSKDISNLNNYVMISHGTIIHILQCFTSTPVYILFHYPISLNPHWSLVDSQPTFRPHYWMWFGHLGLGLFCWILTVLTAKASFISQQKIVKSTRKIYKLFFFRARILRDR